MTKSKTNALEALRALIAERQQYEQWITTLESKREGTPPHVFERVQGDYNNRLQRVVGDIQGHAEELQLSISTLSSRLVEVAREEDTRRDALQEAELRATVGEYEPAQWEQLRTEAEQALEKIAADRGSLDAQLAELRSIQKLSEVGSTGSVETVDFDQAASNGEAASATATSADAVPASTAPADSSPDISQSTEQIGAAYSSAAEATSFSPSQGSSARDQGNFPLEDAAAASAAVLSSPPPVPTAQQPAPQAPSGGNSGGASGSSSSGNRPRSGKTPPFGSGPARAKPQEPRTDQAKTLKCPECGTPNYATEWYCERCGGELATM